MLGDHAIGMPIERPHRDPPCPAEIVIDIVREQPEAVDELERRCVRELVDPHRPVLDDEDIGIGEHRLEILGPRAVRHGDARRDLVAGRPGSQHGHGIGTFGQIELLEKRPALRGRSQRLADQAKHLVRLTEDDLHQAAPYHTHGVIAGLVPAIPTRRAPCVPKRDPRDKPAGDTAE
jgi:hypothetical protein